MEQRPGGQIAKSEKRQGESEKREAARDQSMILHFDHSVTGMTQAKE